MDLFFDHHGTGEFANTIDDQMAIFLARVRLTAPDEVDDFLDEHHASEQFQLKVRTAAVSEKVGELVGGTRMIGFVINAAIDFAPLRDKIIRVFSSAAEAKDERAWFDYVLREIVNTIYGAEALKQMAL